MKICRLVVFTPFAATLALLAACDSPQVVTTPPPTLGPVATVIPQGPQVAPTVTPVPAGKTLPIGLVPRTAEDAPSRDFFGRSLDVAATTAAGTASLIWFATDGSATIWKMFGPSWTGDGATVLTIPSPWRLAASADLNGDGNPDFIWEATTDGTRAVTFMNGPAYAGSYAMMFVFSPDWKIIGAADFNGDSKADLVIYNTVTLQTGVLFLNGTTFTGSFLFLPNYGSSWRPVSVADMNGDSKPDLLFFHVTDPYYFVSLLNGANVLSGSNAWIWSQPVGWRIGAGADFNGDGRGDIVWQNINDGQRRIYYMMSWENGLEPTGEYATLPTVGTANSVIAAVPIKYTVPPLNLKLNNFYVTQSVQDLARSVPLVANRVAFVRAFVTANDYNTAAPVVRVRITQTGGAFSEYMVTRPGDPGVPTFFIESSLGNSYNVTIAAGLVKSGSTISVTVDPSNLIPESDETDNTMTAPLVVRTLPTFDVRFIPVRLTGGETGDVTVSNVPTYMNLPMKLWPFAAYTADVHSTFNSSQSVLSTGAAWDAIISEMSNLRTVEGSSKYYMGVVPRGPSSVYGGYGFLGYPVAIALGVSSATDTSISEAYAHEWGHNFNRPHSPGCGPADPDPSYPVPTGNVDSYGYDASTASAPSPFGYYDIMSYCTPKWIAGYTLKLMMNYVAPFGSAAMAASSPTPTLNVWGRIKADGTVILEPSFEVTTLPRMPEAPGAYTIEGLDASGAVALSVSFAGLSVPDDPQGGRHFSFAIPISSFNLGRIQKLQVVRTGSHTALGTQAARVADISVAQAPTNETLQRDGTGVSLKWNSAAYQMVMVRDAATGEVLSFARGGLSRFRPKTKGDLELDFSTGIRSRTKRVTQPN